MKWKRRSGWKWCPRNVLRIGETFWNNLPSFPRTRKQKLQIFENVIILLHLRAIGPVWKELQMTDFMVRVSRRTPYSFRGFDYCDFRTKGKRYPYITRGDELLLSYGWTATYFMRSNAGMFQNVQAVHAPTRSHRDFDWLTPGLKAQVRIWYPYSATMLGFFPRPKIMRPDNSTRQRFSTKVNPIYKWIRPITLMMYGK